MKHADTRTLEERYTAPMYEVIVCLGYENGAAQYARLEHKGRSEWKTKRIAEKHAREYKATHLRDAWASEC